MKTLQYTACPVYSENNASLMSLSYQKEARDSMVLYMRLHNEVVLWSD